MSLLTAGTKTTSSLQTLQFQPSGMSATDFGNLIELIQSPPPSPGLGGANTTNKTAWFSNGRLFVPTQRAPEGYQVNPGDWILVDGAGWPIVVPGNVFATSWQHS